MPRQAVPKQAESPLAVLNAAMDQVVNDERAVSSTDTVTFTHPVQRDVTHTYIGPDGATQDQVQISHVTTPAEPAGRSGPKLTSFVWRADFTLGPKGVFVNGNALGLQYDAGFTPPAARAEVGKWLYTAAVQKEFPEQYNGLRLNEVWVNWFLGGAQLSVLTPTALEGQTVQRVKEVAHTPSGTVTEVVFIGPHDLPLRVTTDHAGAYPEQEVVDYSGWGRQLPLAVPRHYVPIQSQWLDPAWPGRGQV